MDKKNERLNFSGYTEKQLKGVLRFTEAVARSNEELEEAVESAKKYAKARNEGRSGYLTDDTPEEVEVREQVTSWMKRTNRDKAKSNTREYKRTKPSF